jgi:OmpA-OmpF porin, OOP family
MNFHKSVFSKTLIAVVFSCFFRTADALSQNLVPNPSFEQFVDFTTIIKTGWHKVQLSDSPDYFNLGTEKPSNNVFDTFFGGTKAKTGVGFVGLFCYRVNPSREIKNIREFIETPLIQTLEKDSMYKVEISLCLDAESNASVRNFGILLTNQLLQFNQDFKLFTAKPQIEFTFSIPDCRNNWISFSSYYKATGNEKCVLIGNFRDDRKSGFKRLPPLKNDGRDLKWNLVKNETSAYYYIDDIVIEKVRLEKIADQPETVEMPTTDTLNLTEIAIDSAIVLKNIYFDFDKYNLLPASYTELNKLYNLMANNPSVKIRIEGHTDNFGTYDFNLALSLHRAESVVKYLVEKGITPSRLEYAGFSFTLPLVSNDTDEGRKINRRVTFKIIAK